MNEREYRREQFEKRFPGFHSDDSSANMLSKIKTYVRVTKHEEPDETLGEKYVISLVNPVTHEEIREERFRTVLTELANVDPFIRAVLDEVSLREGEEIEEKRHQTPDEPFNVKGEKIRKELERAMNKPDGSAVLLYSRQGEEEEVKIASDPARAFENTPAQKLGRQLNRELEVASRPRREKLETYRTSDELDTPIKPQRDVSAAAFDEITDVASRLLHQDNINTARIAREIIEAKGGYSISTIYGNPPKFKERNINANDFSTAWEASFNYNAGVMTAELLPDFKTPNTNGFYLDESLKDKIIKTLNSGTVFIRDAHSRAVKDIIGVVKKAVERKGRIEIKGDIADSKVEKILERYPSKLGVSIGGSGTGYCSECNRKVAGMQRCPDHPKASICVKEFDLKEVSLTDQPAWETSKVLKYEKGNSK